MVSQRGAVTIVPIPNQPGCYSVSTGGGCYQCSADAGTCTCRDFLYRRAERHEQCKHLAALAQHLEEERSCPACQGFGRIFPRLVYVDQNGQRDTTPLPCRVCNATGLRDGPLSETELRRIFR